MRLLAFILSSNEKERRNRVASFGFTEDSGRTFMGSKRRSIAADTAAATAWSARKAAVSARGYSSIIFVLAIVLELGQAHVRAGEFDSILRWRNIGPYRGGRTRAIAGVPSQPNVFYMAPVNGEIGRAHV